MVSSMEKVFTRSKMELSLLVHGKTINEWVNKIGLNEESLKQSKSVKINEKKVIRLKMRNNLYETKSMNHKRYY